MKPEDPNRAIVLSRWAKRTRYEQVAGSADTIRKYRDERMWPPTITSGERAARLGKVDDARAAYQKYVDLNPPMPRWRWATSVSSCISEPHEGSIEPLQKATRSIQNAQRGCCWESRWQYDGIQDRGRQDDAGDAAGPSKRTKAIDLDPNGPVGAQANRTRFVAAMGVVSI